MALIFVLSSIPKLPTVRAPFDVHNVAHVVAFAVLCGLMERAFFHQSRYLSLQRNSLAAAFVFACVYGIVDEIHQVYVPGRHSDINDVIADSLGAMLMILWLRLRFGGFRRPSSREDEKAV